MTMITIGVSDTFKTFEYVFNLDENTRVEQLKATLALSLKCPVDNIQLSFLSDVLEDARVLKTLTPASTDDPEMLNTDTSTNHTRL